MNEPKPMSRYDRKREKILQAATSVINECGVSGMTMRDVAQVVELTPATLTYYFKGKEELTTAVFQRRLDSLESIVLEAAAAPEPRERVERLISSELQRLANVLAGREPPLAALPNSNESREFSQIRGRLVSLFARIEGMFGEPAGKAEKDLIGARSYMLIGMLFYMSTWAKQYPVDEFARIQARIMSLLKSGLAPAGYRWTPQIFEVDGRYTSRDGEARAQFLRAATALLNVNGYMGTSVDDISEKLNVTKGSFYHHFDSKDELIEECIRSNYRRISLAISLSRSAGGTCMQQVSSAVATLLKLQFEQRWPLLRSTALASLPLELRNVAILHSNSVALSFASSLIDGIAEGSVQKIDPLIASHVINSTIYSALGLQEWSAQFPTDRAIAIYASTLTRGIFNPAVVEELGH